METIHITSSTYSKDRQAGLPSSWAEEKKRRRKHKKTKNLQKQRVSNIKLPTPVWSLPPPRGNWAQSLAVTPAPAENRSV